MSNTDIFVCVLLKFVTLVLILEESKTGTQYIKWETLKHNMV